MIVKKTVQVDREQEIIIKVTCDVCGKEEKYPSSCSDGYFTETSYDVDKVTIERVSGASYPEGGHENTRRWTICPAYFDDKIAPFIDDLCVTKPEVETTYY